MFYTKWDNIHLQGSYTQINNGILDDQSLTLEEAVIFSIIMARLNLSKLKSTCDKDGNLFITLTNTQIQNYCRCKHEKATQVMQSLESKGYIIRKKSFGAADRIFPVKQQLNNRSGSNPAVKQGISVQADDFDDYEDEEFPF